MKKIILSAASLAVAAVASVSVAPTTSEAIPAFARQTGSACLACHFQSFPTLNGYGRSFKMNALTDVGDQALIEDDMLSIPAVVNWTVMVRPQFNSTKVSSGTASEIAATADQVFMIGGRAGEHTGTFIEYDGTFANVQMFNSWDMGDMKVGVTFFKDGFGEDSGLQLMSVWGQHGGMLNGKGLSINNSMGAIDAAGVTFWAGNEMVQGQLALIDNTSTVGTSFSLIPALRVTSFFDVGDMEIGVGLIAVSGTRSEISAADDSVSKTLAAGTPTVGAIIAAEDAKRTGIDVQLMAEFGDMQVGVFADYATAPKSGTNTNIYNTSPTDDRTGYSFRATIKPLHNMIFIAGIGQDKANLDVLGQATPAQNTIDTTLVGVEYEMYQNFAINLTVASKDDGTTKVDATSLDFELLI